MSLPDSIFDQHTAIVGRTGSGKTYAARGIVEAWLSAGKRVCIKNDATDTITDNDIQDLAHTGAVIAQALAITATRMVNGGTVEVPTAQGDHTDG